jgi:hypothetical protein
LLDLRVRDHGAAGDHVAKLVEQDVVLDGLLESGNSKLRVLQNGLVLLFPDEIAAREEGVGVASVLQFVAHFVVGNAQSNALGFGDHGLAADQILGGAFGKVGEKHRRLFPALRKLLAQHLPGFALHIDRGDGFAGYVGHDSLAGRAQTDYIRSEASRDQGNRHGGANYC